MPEQKKETIVQEQARLKPKIEEVIPEYLESGIGQSLQALLEFCRANGIRYPWSATNIWKLQIKGKTVGMIYVGKYPCQKDHLEKNVWYAHINTGPLLDEFIIKEDLAEVIRKNVIPCAHGNKSCGSGRSVTVFGKDFHGVHGVLYRNPNAETMDCIQKLLKYRVTNFQTG